MIKDFQAIKCLKPGARVFAGHLSGTIKRVHSRGIYVIWDHHRQGTISWWHLDRIKVEDKPGGVG